MFLWFSNCHGKHPLINILSLNWYLYKRSKWENAFIQCYWKHWGRQRESAMGYEMDESIKDFSLKNCSFCSSGGNIFLRIFLRYILVKKTFFNAWIDILKRTYFKRWGTSYRFCLPFIRFNEEQTKTRKSLWDHWWSPPNLKEICIRISSNRLNWY